MSLPKSTEPSNLPSLSQKAYGTSNDLDEPHHQFFGETVEERIEKTVNYLAFNRVDLWKIVLDGRDGFGLKGEALLTFIRRTIEALFAHGAEAHFDEWEKHLFHGKTPEETSDGIITRCATWLDTGGTALPSFVRFYLSDEVKKRPRFLSYLFNQRSLEAKPRAHQAASTPPFVRHHRFFGETIEEWIGKTADNLQFNPIDLTLNSIVSDGIDGFGLESEALLTFIRRTLEALLAHGAEARFDEWEKHLSHGISHREIIEGIVTRCATWLDSGETALPSFVSFSIPTGKEGAGLALRQQ